MNRPFPSETVKRIFTRSTSTDNLSGCWAAGCWAAAPVVMNVRQMRTATVVRMLSRPHTGYQNSTGAFQFLVQQNGCSIHHRNGNPAAFDPWEVFVVIDVRVVRDNHRIELIGGFKNDAAQVVAGRNGHDPAIGQNLF